MGTRNNVFPLRPASAPLPPVLDSSGGQIRRGQSLDQERLDKVRKSLAKIDALMCELKKLRDKEGGCGAGQ